MIQHIQWNLTSQGQIWVLFGITGKSLQVNFNADPLEFQNKIPPSIAENYFPLRNISWLAMGLSRDQTLEQGHPVTMEPKLPIMN